MLKTISKFILLSASLCCITSCKSVDEQYSDLSAKEIYAKGKKAASSNNWTEAVKKFEATEANYPYGEYTEKAQLGMIHALYRKGDRLEALAAASRFIRTNPRHEHVDYAYYMKGLINYHENYGIAFRTFPLDKSKRDASLALMAFNDFKNLLEKFPKSRYAHDAKLRMLQLREQLARSEINVGKFLMKKQAYIGAANRFIHLIEEYPQSVLVEESLILLSLCFDKIKLREEEKVSKDLLNKLTKYKAIHQKKA